MSGLTWFRYHANALNSKRVQKLSDDLFRVWVNCQCILTIEDVGSSGRLPNIDDCAFHLRLSVDETVRKFEKLVDAGLFMKRNETKMKQNETKNTVSCAKNETLFETEKIVFSVKKWAEKQYKSDTSTERVKRFRSRSKTVSETPPDSESESDSESPPTPSRGEPSNEGFDKKKNKKVKIPSQYYEITSYLSDTALQTAKNNCVGWDIYHLARQYDERVRAGTFSVPNLPNKAFPAWVKAFTKGKKP